MSDIKISVETSLAPGTDKEITIIRVDGVIDTMTATELEKVANSLLAQNRYDIIVDLGGVDYISSAGWGIFISNIREIRLNNGDIKLARMIPNVYEIFELLEFDSILKAFDNIEKAKADFAGASMADGFKKIDPKPVAVGGRAKQAVAKAESEKPHSKPTISMGEATAAKINTRQNEEARENLSDDIDLESERVMHAMPGHPRKLEDALMDVVGKDPFLSVGEIRKVVSKEFPKTGRLKTWFALRRLGLSSKKKRFYFARTRRFTK